MQEVISFLREQKKFYVATIQDGRPTIRPFGAVMGLEGKLYIVTSKSKDVYNQIMQNPNIAICTCDNNRKWVRIQGIARLDERTSAKQKMLDDNPILLERRRYTSATDPAMAIFWIDNAKIEWKG